MKKYVLLGLGLLVVCVTAWAQSSGSGADALSNTAIYYTTVAGDGTNRMTAIVSSIFNGATWDRSRSASAANLSAAINTGAVLVERGPRWSVVSAPAVSTLSSSVKAAGAAGVRHVADCIAFSGGSTTAPVATALTINLRDGASGAGTVIWTYSVIVLAATGQNVAPFSVCGLNLPGTAATAMTLEFSSLLTSLNESTSISGFDVN